MSTIQKETDTFLSQVEQDRIAQFNSDPILLNAVKKVMLAEIYQNGTLRADMAPEPLKNGAIALAFAALHVKAVITNEQLGEDLRAFAQAVNLLESGFGRLAKFTKTAESKAEDTNPAV